MQSMQDYEIILVDDGSTDRSGAICDEYASKRENIYAYHKKDGETGYLVPVKNGEGIAGK